MASPAGMRGIRTLRSARFRTLLALVLFVVGVSLVGLLLVRQASLEDGQFGIDFGAYHLAAQRLVEGQRPYAAEMFDGPIDAQGVDRYLYPPLLAQALAPIATVPLPVAASLWLVLQAVAVFAALWMGTGIGGARASVERALWCGVAGVYFLPVFDALWKGNVSGFIALSSLLVATGGARAGLGAAAAALLKVVPLALVPVAVATDARARLSVILALALGVALGVLLAPAAWFDYIIVLRNMLAGSVDYANNLAPAAVAGRLVGGGLLPDLVRWLTLTIAACSVIASVVSARRPSGRPAAALLGVIAVLLLPASLWYHYLVILLPFAAIAWPRAAGAQRGLLFLAAALVSAGLAWLPLTLLGASLLAGASLLVLWPSDRASSDARAAA